MTSSITTDERDGTGAQERHWQPVPCFYLYRLCGDRGDDSSDPMDQSFSGSPFTRSHDGRACRPPQHHRAWGWAWRSELKMLSPPSHPESASGTGLTDGHPLPSLFSGFLENPLGWSRCWTGCPWDWSPGRHKSLGVTVFRWLRQGRAECFCVIGL